MRGLSDQFTTIILIQLTCLFETATHTKSVDFPRPTKSAVLYRPLGVYISQIWICATYFG